MILPLGDSPNPRGIPFVTYLLIAANVAVYVLVSMPLSVTGPDPRDPALREYVDVVVHNAPQGASTQELLRQVTAYDLFVFEHGFRPVDPSISTLFYSLFLHAGFFHLFGNMLFLWIYGDNVEHRLGAGRYLIAYLGTGVVATLFHTVFDSDSPLPLIGASGAISGVLGLYFLWFPHNSVRLLLFLFPFLMDVITVPARILLGFYLILDNVLPFVLGGGHGGGVAHGAHIGGFLAGLSVAWLINRRGLRQKPEDYTGGTVADGASAIEPAIEDGRFSEAARMYFAQPNATKRSLSPGASLELAEWLAQNGHSEAALTAFSRHLHDYPDDRTVAEAHVGAGLVQLDDLGQPAAAYQHLRDALDLAPSAEVAARAREALGRIAAMQKFPLRSVGGRR